MSIKVIVWNEGRHEKNDELVKAVYPVGIHGAVADFLSVHEELEVEDYI